MQAYRIPPATGSNMLMIVDGSWHSVYMTQGSNAAYYYGVGNWGIASTADNAWHYQCINLHQQTQTSMGPGSHQVQSLILYSHGGGPYGGPLWMDVFQISAAGASVNSGASSKASYDLDTFETGAIWASRNGYTPVQDCTTSFQGLCSLYMGTGWGQNFEGGANIRPGMSSSGFSTQVFPYMCMVWIANSVNRAWIHTCAWLAGVPDPAEHVQQHARLREQHRLEVTDDDSGRNTVIISACGHVEPPLERRHLALQVY